MNDFIKSWLNFRTSFRIKVLGQGLYHIPLPWFALSCWVSVPLFFYLLNRGMVAFVPESWSYRINRHSFEFFIGAALIQPELGKNLFEKWKRKFIN